MLSLEENHNTNITPKHPENNEEKMSFRSIQSWYYPTESWPPLIQSWNLSTDPSHLPFDS